MELGWVQAAAKAPVRYCPAKAERALAGHKHRHFSILENVDRRPAEDGLP